jgi:hypothetical protein
LSVTRTAPQLIEQAGLQGPGIEDGLQTPGGQLLYLLVREVDSAALRDTRTDVSHDLLDIDPIATVDLLGWRRLSTLRAPPVGAAPTAVVEMSAAASLLIVIHQ